MTEGAAPVITSKTGGAGEGNPAEEEEAEALGIGYW
jgi:hypothetical protein